jgi:myosin-crossreactive antigen
LVIGVIALYFGFNATNAPMEEVTEAFTGQYSDQTMVYLIGGAIAGIAGLVMLFRK